MHRQTKQRQTGDIQMSETMTQPDSTRMNSIDRSSSRHPAGFSKQSAFAFADYGQRRWTVLLHNNAFELDSREFVALDWMKDCRQLVSEASHIQTPQTERSFAQPLSLNQIKLMDAVAKKKQIEIYVVSHHQNRTVRQLMGQSVEKTYGEDEIDCRCWSGFIQKHPVSMHKLRTNFDDSKRMAIYEFKDRTNQILNAARRFGYQMNRKIFVDLGYDVETDACLVLLELAGLHRTKGDIVSDRWNAVAHKCPQELREAIYSFSPTQLYSLAAMFFDPFTNERRVRSDTHEPPGVNWLMRNIVGCSPFHHRGGTARSNIYHHGVKNFSGVRYAGKMKQWSELTEKELGEVRKKRSSYIKAVKVVVQLLRNTANKEQKASMLF